MLSVGDVVENIYTGITGIVLKHVDDSNELQDYYLIRWSDNSETVTAREELLV